METASPNLSDQKNDCSAQQKPKSLHFKVGNLQTLGYRLSLRGTYPIIVVFTTDATIRIFSFDCPSGTCSWALYPRLRMYTMVKTHENSPKSHRLFN